MPLSSDHHTLLRRRDELRQALASIGELRPGSLKSRYRKCGKPNCHCAREGDPGHGPHWSLSRLVKGTMHSRAIPAHAVQDTQRQVEECHRLRVDRQIGRDDSLDEYIESIVDTFAKVRWVLTEDGTVWVNAGDSYSSPGWWSPSSSPPTVTARESEIRMIGTPGWIEYFTTRRYGEPRIGGGVSAWYGRVVRFGGATGISALPRAARPEARAGGPVHLTWRTET